MTKSDIASAVVEWTILAVLFIVAVNYIALPVISFFSFLSN